MSRQHRLLLRGLALVSTAAVLVLLGEAGVASASVATPTGTSLAVSPTSRPDVYFSTLFANNSRVVELTPAGVQSTIASGLYDPSGVAVDPAGDVYIADTNNYRVIKVTPAGAQSTVWPGMYYPSGVALDASGDLYMSDSGDNYVVRLTPSGHASTLGSGLNFPTGVAVDSAGDLYIADLENGRVVEVTPGGVQSTIASGLNYPYAVAVDSAGDVYVAGGMGVIKVTPSGTQSSVGSGFSGPTGLAVDAAGDVFVADTYNDRVVEVTPSGTQPTLATPRWPGDPGGVAVDNPPSLVTYGQVVTLRSTVISSPPGELPSGTVTFADGSKTLGSATLSGSSPDVATLTTTALGAGSHTITAHYSGGSGYLSSGSAPVKVDVTPALLKVTANDVTRPYGPPNPAFAPSYSGFVLGQDLSSSGVSGSPACATTASSSSPPGTYPITCTRGSLASANYSFDFAAGTLTVTKAPTALAATPALLGLQPPTTALFNLSATLSSEVTKAGLAGQSVVFSAGSSVLCRAVTNASGTATCDALANPADLPQVLQADGYQVTYPGSPDYLGSSTSAPLVGA
ncbi:MAG: Ig-like domain repeat protein [Acidimicrobiales bacterium]